MALPIGKLGKGYILCEPRTLVVELAYKYATPDELQVNPGIPASAAA